MEGELIADAEKRVGEFAAKKGTSTVPVETRVTLGEAVWEICRMAEQEHADLIIMGSHGRTGLSHIVLGSVAERVVRHASCPCRGPPSAAGEEIGTGDGDDPAWLS